MQSQEKNRIEFLDYMKAVCVIMVIITHYEWPDKTSPLFTMVINMAVPMFMIISGYNFAMSNRKKISGSSPKVQQLKRMYRWDTLKPKLIRFVIPFSGICLVEMVLLAIEDKNINPLRIFLLGAYGPGSYYVPIMIQLLLIFPIIYVLVEKNAKYGIIATGVANLVFEVAVKYSGMEKYYYRLCIGRYLLLIAFGCYLYLYPEHRVKRREMVVMFLLGLAYLVAVYGFDAEFVLFDYWKTTAMPVAFYVFPIVILMFRRFYHFSLPGILGVLFEKIGQASYHIFLVQMVYYHFELGGIIMDLNWYYAVPINIIINISVGILFFQLDNQFIRGAKKVKHTVKALV